MLKKTIISLVAVIGLFICVSVGTPADEADDAEDGYVAASPCVHFPLLPPDYIVPGGGEYDDGC